MSGWCALSNLQSYLVLCGKHCDDGGELLRFVGDFQVSEISCKQTAIRHGHQRDITLHPELHAHAQSPVIALKKFARRLVTSIKSGLEINLSYTTALT